MPRSRSGTKSPTRFQALVVGRWTRPDGSSCEANAWTDSKGAAAFTIQGSGGLYTLTILNIMPSQYTFNPTQSVLSTSITVPAQDRALYPGHVQR